MNLPLEMEPCFNKRDVHIRIEKLSWIGDIQLSQELEGEFGLKFQCSWEFCSFFAFVKLDLEV